MASHSVYLSVAARSSINKMLSRILAIFAIVVAVACHTESAPAVNNAKQFLPALPGYVPVYIRPGDTPLEDINPDLAEAFNSYAQKHARLSFARANAIPDGQIHVQISHSTDDISIVDDLSLEDQNTINAPLKSDSLHIQKIPRI